MDNVKASDGASVGHKNGVTDHGGAFKKIWRVARYKNAADKAAGVVYSLEEAMRLFSAPQFSTFEKNVLLNEGINEILTPAICGSTITALDNANAHLGVGESDAAESATHTGLQGTSKTYMPMASGYPTFGTGQEAEWQAEFGADDANYDWREFTVANGDSDAADNFNRKVSNEGTKVSGQTWTLTLTISFS